MFKLPGLLLQHHASIFVHTHVHIFTWMYRDIHMYIHIHIHIYYICVYIHMHTCIEVHTDQVSTPALPGCRAQRGPKSARGTRSAPAGSFFDAPL